ncbi:MAG: CHAT domain-containing protein, partial [Bacteroidota bacterium]
SEMAEIETYFQEKFPQFPNVKAFQLDGSKDYFWNKLLENQYPFAKFDFALFSYGKIDVSYLLELDFPVNNLIKISEELNGYITDYKNVLLIAHSQGGLVAKTYASLFYQQQGIHLLTLHTPHRNKSFSVMRFNQNEIWQQEACYQVPHIFCASINDNKIVKPDNAFATSHDRKYLSKDQTKQHLGHSHLSKSPDKKLLKIYIEEIFNFINSGLSRVFCNTIETHLGNYPSKYTIVINYSRSLAKLNDFRCSCKKTMIIDRPWRDLVSQQLALKTKNTPKSIHADCNILIEVVGCSVNYFAKYLLSRSLEDTCIELHALDSLGGESRGLTYNYLYEYVFHDHYSETNPYKHIPFDTYDFKKGSLIEDSDFLNIFLRILKSYKFTLSASYELGFYKDKLWKYYLESVKEYRRIITLNIYKECFIEPSIGIEVFEQKIEQVISSINRLQEKKNYYRIIYQIIKIVFQGVDQDIDIRTAEIIVSKLMKSDGDVYWLDNYLRQVYDVKVLANTTWVTSYNTDRNESQFLTNDKRFNSTIHILFLAADPTNRSRLRLGKELREIQEKLQLSKLREKFKLHERMSVRPADISQALLDIQPKVVHFSGHGTFKGALCFENQVGEAHSIQPDALAALFGQFADQVDCVVLNACYSEAQANAIAEHIDYVIGMNQAIDDRAAISFSVGFYQALGAGHTIEKAYKLGCVQIRLQDIPEHLTPIMVKNDKTH